MATSTQIVWTFIFEILFLHEALNLWSLAGTGLILGYMMIVGIIKVMESGKQQYDVIDEEGGDVDEEGVLLEPPSHESKTGYGATSTDLQWQRSNSF